MKQASRFQRKLRALTLSLGLLQVSCMPNGFLASRDQVSKPKAGLSDPKTQANDRPTESGAGLPGYLVGCIEQKASTSDSIDIACKVADTQGQKPKQASPLWQNFRVTLPADANAGIKVSAAPALEATGYDVIFSFSGASLTELRALAQRGSYEFVSVDADGQTQVSRNAKAPLPIPSLDSMLSCAEGVLVDAQCFVSIPLSCTQYCSAFGKAVHPLISTKYGSSAIDGAAACQELQGQMPANKSNPLAKQAIQILNQGLGLGCYSLLTGQAYFDTSPTSADAEPPAGFARVCACQ